MDTSKILTGYENTFNKPAEKLFFSPGRINLIGEHTDYNGGNVFPCAISLGTYAAFGNRSDQTIQMYSENIPDKGIINVSLDKLEYDKADDWANYLKGMIYLIVKAGYKIDHGFNLYIHGNLPDGAGLSSSASIELLMGNILNDVFNLGIDQLDIVKMGQQNENNYIGVNSGIMDEFAIGMGKKDQATLLRRARHAVFENQRTLKAVKYLQDNNLVEFGKLVNASHISLHYDYEVTGVELDSLVEAAWQQPGVLGARMVGAGFGGCAIAFVEKDQVDNFKENVGKIYKDKVGYAADFYIAEISDGPSELKISEVEK
ncbi:galactokinase family protein [Companilactobacillus halodurans]|uniref:Galactokinase n=1 Tax=Companilactobacillus halodurans TaxID=2584183 RepID=A0A5P0ZYP4_9LACO|nr:galactokinase family protein [Companilactobacillus halodurans]MQS98169.1 galactokinase [Companilactobacillus halodurans]